MLIHGRGADDPGDETEVRGESVVEAVHDVAQESARRRPVPRLSALAGNFTKSGGVVGGFASQDEGLEVRFDFASLFFQQHRQQESGSEPFTECRQQTRSTAWTKARRRMSVLFEKVRPDHYVPIFDVRQSRIDVFLFWIRFRGGEDAIQIGGIRFILPVMLERVNVDFGGPGWGGAGLQRR